MMGTVRGKESSMVVVVVVRTVRVCKRKFSLQKHTPDVGLL